MYKGCGRARAVKPTSAPQIQGTTAEGILFGRIGPEKFIPSLAPSLGSESNKGREG